MSRRRHRRRAAVVGAIAEAGGASDQIEEARDFLRKWIELASQEDEWIWRGYLLLDGLSKSGADNPLSFGDDEADKDVDERLLAAACGGDVSADAALCWMGASFVRDGSALPPRLRWYVAKKLKKLGDRHYAHGFCGPSSPEIWPLRHGLGRPPRASIRRDFAISVLIAVLTRGGGVRATRNETKRGTETHSACSIVAEALKGLGANLDEVAIAKIWNRHQDLVGLFDLEGAVGKKPADFCRMT
jgi:hypothetical protein